jgi:hypothetical protein
MSQIVVLDSGPLGLLTNPKLPPTTVAMLSWAKSLRGAGHRLVVPAIADYEVRRELVRAGKRAGIAELDAWSPEYLPLSDSALRMASTRWARSRAAGASTADPKELDGDVLIAAQAFDMGFPSSDLIIATTNPGHLSQFVRCDLWTDIKP